MEPHEIQHSTRYVIQRHVRGKDQHWDFMLESGDRLATWRIHVSPEQLGQTPAHADRIADHPLRFLTYEGPVNQGAGMVAIADRGTCTLVGQATWGMSICVQGEVLKGLFRLEKSDCGDWLLRRDEPADS